MGGEEGEEGVGVGILEDLCVRGGEGRLIVKISGSRKSRKSRKSRSREDGERKLTCSKID